MRSEILARKGVDVKHVVMTSDEKDIGWWDEVQARGWYRMDLAAVRAEEGAGSEWYVLPPIFSHPIRKSRWMNDVSCLVFVVVQVPGVYRCGSSIWQLGICGEPWVNYVAHC